MKIMASGPITSWQIEREKVETVTDFIFLGYQIIAGGYWSPEIERCLLLGRKALTDLDSVFKRRDIILLTKVHIVKDMVFPVVMYGCESWSIKKAEHWRTDLLCCRRFWKSLWLQGHQTSQSLRKSTLNMLWKDWCWSCNTLAIWCKVSTHGKRPLCCARLKAKEKGATEDEMAGWHHWLNGHEFKQT